MSRDLADGLASEIVKPALRPFFAVHIALDDPVSGWTGAGPLTFGGRTYEGTGAFGSVGTVGEGADGAAVGIQTTLSGIDPEFGDDVLGQEYRGKAFELYVGAVDEAYTSTVAAPKLLWKGAVDKVELADGEQLSVTVTAESRMRDQGRPRIRRFTDQEQRRRFSGDLFFEYLPQLVEVSILWGKAG